LFDGHAFVNDADTAFLRDGNGQTGFGNSIHSSRNQRNIELDCAGQTGLERHVFRGDIGITGHQQNIIKRESLFSNAQHTATSIPTENKSGIINGCADAVNKLHAGGNYRKMPAMTLFDPIPGGHDRDILSVSQLNRRAKQLLETHLPLLWVEGELSNLSQPSSGHWYFTLKDRGAQLRCAMFRLKNLGVSFSPRSGQHVLVRGRVTLYEARGDYQLVVEHMEEAGVGALRREFERLKAK